MKHFVISSVLFSLIFACSACDKANAGEEGGQVVKGEQKTLAFTPFMELNQTADNLNSHEEDYSRSALKMMYNTLQEHGASEGYQYPRYPRIRRMSDGTYIQMWQTPDKSDLGTNNGKDVYYVLSSDLKTWTTPEKLFASRTVSTTTGSDTRHYTNGNGIVLSNGDFLAVAAFRTPKTYNYINSKIDQGIVIRRSKDCGKSWTNEQTIYNGPCWEAHLMEVNPGEIHCYFAESRPWISGSHSGTSLVVSNDGGATWSPSVGNEPYRVMRKKWWSDLNQTYFYTDQMAVGVILNGTKQMAFATECVASRDLSNKQTYFISVVYSPEDGQWKHLTGDEEADCERLDNFLSGGGPYLVQFPSGETVVAYSNSKDSKMHYTMGDAKARNFSGDYISLPHKGSWGGMEVDTPHSVLFCRTSTEASVTGSDRSTLMLARFALNHSIRATTRNTELDADNKEWQKTDDALFLGSESPIEATLRCSQDSENIYFLVEVQDDNLSNSDNVAIMLSPEVENNKLTAKAIRIKVGCNGLKNTDIYSGGWRSKEFGVKVRAAYDGTPGNTSDKDNGYLVEVAVPRSAIEITNGRLLCNFALFDSAGAFEDAVSGSAATDTKKWVAINGL